MSASILAMDSVLTLHRIGHRQDARADLRHHAEIAIRVVLIGANRLWGPSLKPRRGLANMLESQITQLD